MANEAEIRRWNDQRWTTAWPGREAITTAVTPHLLAALTLAPGQRVLDIGCGGGGLAIELAGAVAPDGLVVGVDISDALLELARQRADDAGVTTLELQNLDMQSGTLGGDLFPLAVSQFGVMFFDEPVVAFTNIARHLQRGGQLTFACWQSAERNPWHIGLTMSALVPPPAALAPGKSAVGPFTLGDVDRTAGLLTEAGFRDVELEPRQMTVRGPATAVGDTGLLDFMGVPAERLDEANDIVERHLEQFRVGEDAFDFPLAFLIVTARLPTG